MHCAEILIGFRLHLLEAVKNQEFVILLSFSQVKQLSKVSVLPQYKT